MRLKGNLVNTKSDQLGNAQPRGDSDVKHCAPADSEARCRIRRIQDGLALFGGEMVYQANAGFLNRNAENSFDLLERRRYAMFDKVHERLDSRQTDVAGLRAVATAFLEVLKELQIS